MGKNIVVDGCTLSIEGNPSASGTLSVTSTPETNAKVGNKGIFAGSLSVSVSGYTSAVITVASSGTGNGTINGTGIVKINNKKVLLEGDSVSVAINGQAVSGNTTVPASENVTVKISNAGQDKIRSN